MRWARLHPSMVARSPSPSQISGISPNLPRGGSDSPSSRSVISDPDPRENGVDANLDVGATVFDEVDVNVHEKRRRQAWSLTLVVDADAAVQVKDYELPLARRRLW